MPNWCENRLTITGDKTQLAKLKKDAMLKYKKVEKGEEKENPFSIAKLYPMPKELDGISSPPTIVSEKEYKAKLAQYYVDKIKADKAMAKNGEYVHVSMPVTQAIVSDLEKRYGACNWYDWSIGHWGTKWDVKCYSKNTDSDMKKNKCLNYDFDSAWSPPASAILWISRNYPKLTFTLEYCEPSMCFSGTYIVKNGEVIEDDARDGEVWEEYQCHHEKLKKGDFCDNCCKDIE